jgi:arabinogalactan endo-1,4-beta-galactosidase
MKIKFTREQYRFVLTALIMLIASCFSSAQNPITTTFSKGGDVSWLPQMEATGYKFYDVDGAEKDCLQLLKDRGMNTIRLRVFVNPSNNKTNGHCSPAETVAMAVRAKNMGMRIMIDFHYSDTWADPGQQTKPAAWASHTLEQLKNDVYTHTYDVLNALKLAGVTPEWVQVGNEIPSGMLWPEGKTPNWGPLAQLLNKGYEATKAINPSIKVVIHIDQGNENGRFRWFFDNIQANSVKYDVIGMSYYPYWINSDYTATINALQNNLNDMASRYGKEVMVVEVGGDYSMVQNTYDMLKAVISAVKSVPNNKGLGVIYWEPQGAKSWSGYQLNAWQNDGKPSVALNAFSDTLGPPVVPPSEEVKVDGFVANPVQQASAVTVNLTYSANSATHFFYVAVVKRSSSGAWLGAIAQSTNNQFLVPSVGINLTAQVSLSVPIGTTPSANLTNGEYYDVQVELQSLNWGGKIGTSISSKLNVVPSGSLGVEDALFDNNLIVYPNPVSNILSFKSADGVLIKSLKITNLLGKIVFSDDDVAKGNFVDVSNLSSGIYILSINSGVGIQQSKFNKK